MQTRVAQKKRYWQAIFRLLLCIGWLCGCENAVHSEFNPFPVTPTQKVEKQTSNSDTSYRIPANKQAITICSWNLKDFGRSKSDEEIAFMANTIANADVLAIQEVVTAPGGAQAVARLAEELNRKGTKWQYVISDPTTGTPSSHERYAFLWKPSSLTLKGKPELANRFAEEIDREPYMATFSFNTQSFTLVSFHAVPKSKNPETEIKLLQQFITEYPDRQLLFTGDFNCPQSNSVFNSLKNVGYVPIFTQQKTSLRHKCINEDCLASEFDNLFYPPNQLQLLKSGVVHFYKQFDDVKAASYISDHLPIYVQFKK